MKRLIILVLFVFAAWQAWKHYPELIRRPPAHEVVIENQSGRGIERLRLRVGGHAFVRDSLPPSRRASFPFRVSRDSEFQLEWAWSDQASEASWRGGLVPAGPLVQRHRIVITREGGVTHLAEPLPER